METLVSIPVRAARAVLRKDDVVVRRFGQKFDLNLRDHTISAKLLVGRKHEPMECLFIERHVGSGDTVLDIGANIGWFSLLFARLVRPGGKVLAFEPDPTNLTFLQRNVALNGADDIVTIVPAAVGSSPGTATLHRNIEGNYGDQRIVGGRGGEAAIEGRARLEVPVVAVDDVVKGYPQIRFIKMDIQGYEPFAFDGMARVLQSSDELIVLSEFWPAGIRAGGRDPKAMLETMLWYGFHMYELASYREELIKTSVAQLLRKYSTDFAYGNLVFSKTELA